MPNELMMPSNHLILCHPVLFLPSIFPSFPMSQSFASGGQSTGVSASASVIPMNIQGWFLLGLTGLIFLQSKRLSRDLSNIRVQKHQLLSYKKECIWVHSKEVMKLEPIIQTEVSQKRETPIQYINTYIWNWGRWWQWSYMQYRKRDTDVKNRLLFYIRDGKDGMIWENSIENVCYHIQNRWPVQVWCMKQGTQSWDNPEGQGGDGVVEGSSGWGIYVHPWLIHVDVRQKIPQIPKVIILQLFFFLKQQFLALTFLYGPSLISMHDY